MCYFVFNVQCLIADLQPDFRLLPESTRAVLGEAATLHCQAPRGQPEAQVTWRRNGLPLSWDDELALDKERYTSIRQYRSCLIVYDVVCTSSQG